MCYASAPALERMPKRTTAYVLRPGLDTSRRRTTCRHCHQKASSASKATGPEHLDDRSSVLPSLEYLERLQVATYIHRDVGTRGEKLVTSGRVLTSLRTLHRRYPDLTGALGFVSDPPSGDRAG